MLYCPKTYKLTCLYDSKQSLLFQEKLVLESLVKLCQVLGALQVKSMYDMQGTQELSLWFKPPINMV